MTKNEFKEILIPEDDWDKSSEYIAGNIKSFCTNNRNTKEALALLGCDINDISDGDIIDVDYDVDNDDYSYPQYIIRKAVSAEIAHNKFLEIMNECESFCNWDEFYNVEDYFDDAFPSISEIIEAINDIAETIEFDEENTQSKIEELANSFEEQIKEKGIDISNDTIRNLLLHDFYSQFKAGVENPIVGDGLK